MSFPLRALLDGRLARAGVWLFIANLLQGVLGYAYQILMGRMLSPPEYGLLSAIMALSVIIAVPVGAATMILTRKFAEYGAHGGAGEIAHLRWLAYRWAVLCSLLYLVLFFFAVPVIRDYLNVPSSGSIYLLGLVVLVSLFIVTDSALIQGMQAFEWYGGGVTLATVVKISLSVLLVWMGYGINGALFALFLTGLVMWGIFNRGSRAYRKAQPVKSKHRFTASDTLPIVAATVVFTVMTQLDMVLVRHYFNSHDTGIYAAAAILGKSVLYLPVAITMVLFPMVAENHARNESSAHLLTQAVILVGILSGGAALLFLLFPEWLIHVFYGEAYVGAATLLRYFGFAMLPMALVMVAEHFLIAKGQVLFVYLFVLVAPIQVAAVSLFHDTLLDVVKVMVVCGSLLMLLGYMTLWAKYRKTKGKQ